MCDPTDLLDRVQHSLQRLGYTQIESSHLGEGRVRLSGRIRSFEERAIMVAAVRTVNGVTSVTLNLNLDRR